MTSIPENDFFDLQNLNERVDVEFRLCPESFAHLWRHVEGGGRFIVGSFVGYFVEVYGRE
jgi:hypothetical protein